MECIVRSEDRDAVEIQAKMEVLDTLESEVADLMEQHVAKRNLWHSSDFLPADEKMDEDQDRAIAKLRDRARGIADSARVALALNLITEEGLPHFHRLIATHLGPDSFWQKWNFMWTAEEDRHGVALRDYVRDARIFKFRHVEMMQYAYNEKGFTPDWQYDPYRIFAYTTVQERATQVSHRNTGRVAGAEEPTLAEILRNIAADEAKHYSFYRQIVKRCLDLDPNRALQSILKIIPSIDMPGHTMPSFREMADIVRRIGIYGPLDYKELVEDVIHFWKIGVMDGLNDFGRQAQEKIMDIPKRLDKVSQYIDQRTKQKSFSFNFLYDRVVAMD